MDPLKMSIDECLRKRAEVYRIDPERMQRDLASAKGTIKDHSGRWFFELIQNSDDAQASAVEVHVTDDAVYICDNGTGLLPDAVEAISGTYFSDKTTDTIGHKGIGFKAVYEITEAPEIYGRGDQGLLFSEEEARRWFDERCLTPPVQGVPYEWIPIFRSRSTAEDDRPYLRSLQNLHTVVVLPFRSDSLRSRVIETLRDWPAELLLPFNHLRRLRIQNETADGEFDFRIEVRRDTARWTVLDTRSSGQRHWRVMRGPCRPPLHVLETLDPYDRDRASEIGILLAAPISEDGAAVPTSDYPNLHVFYPTEQEAPVRLLIHAEFLLKSDRTAIVPIQSSQFNSWVAEEVADLVARFVNDTYSRRDPASFLQLLLPSDHAESEDGDSPARHLWERIRSAARERLLLPDTERDQQLRLDDALLLSVSIDPAAARGILEPSVLAPRLVHESFDENRDAQRALRKLGCTELRDSDIVDVISHEAADHWSDQDWVWACWCWLATWLRSSKSETDQSERLEVIQDLPIIPVATGVVTPASLQKSIVTWRLQGGSAERLPEWLPIVFVRDWFRDRVVAISADDDLKGLLAKLRIDKPGEDVVIRGLEKGIRAYWEQPDDSPVRFLWFLLSQQWDPSTDLARLSSCPVPVRLGQSDETRWFRADVSYFGQAWGEVQLPLLYSGESTVPWAQPLNPDCRQQERELLQRIGVVGYPRVIEDASEEAREAERRRVHELLGSYTTHEKIHGALVLDRVSLAELEPQSAACIIRLVSRHWHEYYDEQHTQQIAYFYYSDRRMTVDALWWSQLVTELTPPLETDSTSQTPLPKCWVPDKDVRRLIGDLIPIVNLDAFNNDVEEVLNWLVNVVKIRRTLNEIPLDEWRVLLCEWIPNVCPAEHVAQKPESRDRVARWYEACLLSVGEQSNRSYSNMNGILEETVLLARKAEAWQYRSCREVWIADEQAKADAFAHELWQAEFKASQRSDAAKYFGLRRLSTAVEMAFQWEHELPQDSQQLQRELDAIKEYLFVWRRSQTTTDPDELRTMLQSLEALVVDSLHAILTLEGIGAKRLEKVPWGTEDHQVLVSVQHWENRVTLMAQAVARIVGPAGDADFYENLLRCQNDSDRTAKLISKGLTNTQVERYRRSFREEVPPEPGLATQIAGEPGTDVQPETSIPPPAREVDTGFPAEDEPGPPKETPAQATEQLVLKDVLRAKIRFSSAPRERRPIEIGESETQRRQREVLQLSREQRDEVEQAARTAAGMMLEEQGYSVTYMPTDNPGYDLKAEKQGAELHVEVKGHLNDPTVVIITSRQLLDYGVAQRSGDHQWELWNVANLSSASAELIKVTRYRHIPPDALTERQLALDLTKCIPVDRNDP